MILLIFPNNLSRYDLCDVVNKKVALVCVFHNLSTYRL
jgi:hypothetical protein